MSSIKYILPIARYSLVICRNPHNKYLCVLENAGKWWIPGGGVQPNQTHAQAAIRQAKQQTGIDIRLKGILSFDQLNFGGKKAVNGYRIVYYAQPVDQNAIPKQSADKQSIKAQYLTLYQIKERRQSWRVPQIYNYPRYIESGGEIFPLSIFKQDSHLP